VADGVDALEHALGLAYRYLNRRERTEAEMRGHLASRGVDHATVEEAIETLRDQGYIDDARFARMLAEEKRELEGWGGERILHTLLARGVDRDLAREVLARDEPGDELERAVALLRRRFPSGAGDRRERDRALGVLLRKGYGSELALEALAAHTPGHGEDDLR
jgi:regulatory protein